MTYMWNKVVMEMDDLRRQRDEACAEVERLRAELADATTAVVAEQDARELAEARLREVVNLLERIRVDASREAQPDSPRIYGYVLVDEEWPERIDAALAAAAQPEEGNRG